MTGIAPRRLARTCRLVALLLALTLGFTLSRQPTTGAPTPLALADSPPITLSVSPSSNPLSLPVTLTASVAASIGSLDANAVEFDYAPAGTGQWTSLGTQPLFDGLAGPYTESFPASGQPSPPDGLYDLRAVLTEPDGTTSVSVVRDQLVAANSPTVALAAAGGRPLPSGSALGGTVALVGSALPSPDTGVKASSFDFQVSPAGAEQWQEVASVPLPSGQPAGFDFDTTTVPDGTYDLRAVPVDANGDTYATAPVRGVIIDNTPPQVTIDDPESPLSGTVSLSVQACDYAPPVGPCSGPGTPGSGVASVRYERALAGTSAWTQIASSAEPPFSASVATTGWPNGSYELRAVATDRAGNTGSSNLVAVTSSNSAPPPVRPSIAGVAVPAKDITLLGTDTGTGETWATGYTSATPAIVDGMQLPYTTPGDQFVLLRRTAAGGWQVADVLRDSDGSSPFPLLSASAAGNLTPYPVQAVGAMLPSGEAWLWVYEGTSVYGLFHREPGGHFVYDQTDTTALAGLLDASPAGAQLRLGQDSGQPYGIIVSPQQAKRTTSVGGQPVDEWLDYALLDGQTWAVHTASLPPSYQPQSGDGIKLAYADVSGPGAGWGALEVNGGTAALPLLLGRFDGDRWTYVDTGLDALDLTGTVATPGAAVAPTGLTADGDAVWIGARVSVPPAKPAATNLVARYDYAGGQGSGVTNSWCTLAVPSSCAEPLDTQHPAAVPDAIFDNGTVALSVTATQAGEGQLDVFSDGDWSSIPAPGYQPGNDTFTSPTDGWLGAAGNYGSDDSSAVGQVTAPGAAGSPLAAWPVAERSPLTSVALPPGGSGAIGESGALAVGFDGTALLYSAQNGWLVQPTPPRVHHLYLTSVAFDGPSSAFAVGEFGAILHWDGSSWTEDPQSISLTQWRLNSVTFDSSGQGWAVGEDGTILHYDGQSWSTEQPPPDASGTAITSVAVAGSGASEEVFAIAGGNLIVRQPDGTWADAPTSLLPSNPAPDPGSLRLVAGLPDGGAVIAGVSVVLVRQGPGEPFAASDQPLEGIPVALAAFRDGSGQLRPAVSVAQGAAGILSPYGPTNDVGGYPAGDGELLIEGADGWQDLSRADSSSVAADLPEDGELNPDPVLGVAVGAGGQGLWAVGGYDGTPTSNGLGSSDVLAARATGWETAAVWRYDAGGGATPPNVSASPPSLSAAPGTVSFAFFSDPECRGQCTATHDAQPWTNLAGALAQMSAFASQPGGPLFAMLGGNAVGPNDSNAWASGNGAADFAQLPTVLSQLTLPLFAAYGPLDAVPTEPDPTQPWSYAFAASPAPFGGGGSVPGINPVSTGSAAPGTVSRYYSFDATQNGATVRVIVLDNSKRSLDGSEPSQSAWLNQQLAAAAGVPTVVIAAQSLLNASDGPTVAAKLVAAGVLAVFTGPADGLLNEHHDVPAGAAQTIPEYEGATLGYQQSANDGVVWYDVSVDAVHRSVSVDAVPVVQSLALEPLRGLTAARSLTLPFQAIARRPPGSLASSPKWDGGGSPFPGYDNYAEIPASGSAAGITPTYAFKSSNPEIGTFVTASGPGSVYPKLSSSGHPIANSQSGLFCAYNAGTTTVSITTGLLSYSLPVTVLPGGYGSPCGTVALTNVNANTTTFKSAKRPGSVVVRGAGGAPPAAVPPPPPAAAAAVAGAAPPIHLAPPPPAPAPSPTPVPRPAPPARVVPVPPPTPSFQSPAVPVPLPVPLAIVPPLAVATQPIPPGGTAQQPATAERREKAHKHAHSKAYTLLAPASNASDPAAWWYEGGVGVVSLMALALAGQALRPRRRPREARAEARRH